MPVVPSQAQVVVVGGGIIGTSVAYHLAREGVKEVVLLERDRLTSGTTWHAAGLMVTFGSLSDTSTEMRKYTRDLYARLEAETGQATGFKAVGFIELASDSDRLEEYRRISVYNRYKGVDVRELSPAEVKAMFPLVRVDDVLAGFYVEKDGRTNPVDTTMALGRAARQLGVKVIEGVACSAVTVRNGAVSGVETNAGTIQCETVVNCAGMWARQLAAKSGVNVPLQAAEHYYLITESIPGLKADWPVIEDPRCHGYYREEGGGLLIGLFEPECAPWRLEGVPDEFSFGEITPDWDRMTPYLQTAMSRVPVSMEVGVKKFFCGPESFTPDLAPIVGEAPELKNYFVAAGLNSIGILTGGGLGRVLAHWIATGSPDVDVTGFNIDRLQVYQSTKAYRKARTVEALGLVYQCHYPHRPMKTARGAKRSPLHEQLRAQGAYFRDVSGWEGADWYAGPGAQPETGPLTFGKPSWFSQWAAEHRAAREGVVLMDMSFMAKFRVEGRDAGRLLNHLSCNEIDGPAGRVTYTQWLNDRGTVEADLTVTKRSDEAFLVVASDTAHRHVETLLRRQLTDEMRCHVVDVTSGVAQINVQGPKSRALLQSLTDSALSNDDFPFRTAREIDIGFAKVLCLRITYVGELGYELYLPAEQAAHVYERLLEAGRAFDVRHAGLKALSSLRLEKGYRDYGHDIDNTDTVLEVGLGFAVDLTKAGGFRGRERVVSQKAQWPLRRGLVSVLLKDPEVFLFHGEVVHRNGRAIGTIRSASYGHTVGGAVGLAMIEASEPITASFIETGVWSVDVAGLQVPARVSLRAFYDPENRRVRNS